MLRSVKDFTKVDFIGVACMQGGAIGMSPQGLPAAGAQLHVVDSLFMGNSAVNGAGVFVQK